MFFARTTCWNESGSVATVFCLATPLLIGGSALAVDAASLANQLSHLQSVADSTALAGAKELHLYRTDYASLEETVRERGRSLIATQSFLDSDAEIDVAVDGEAARVTVTIAAEPETVLLGKLGYATELTAVSEAGAFGSSRLCVLALDDSGAGAIRTARIGTISAPECAVQSNSAHPSGIEVEALSRVVATGICSSGGVAGPDSAFEPEAVTDCPPIEDPLADQPLAPPEGCDYLNVKLILGLHSISPGHYCGGLKLLPAALVTAEPGEYIISGGPLDLGLASSLRGEDVSFRFVDDAATFKFGLGSIVSLSAPREGPMAGYLFYQDAGTSKGRVFTIATDLATNLLGTVYLPNGTLNIDVVGLVAAQSAYTVIVADQLDIKGADLRINSDYGATDVPVPQGVGPTGGQVALRR